MEKLITPAELSETAGYTYSCLERMRAEGTGPKFIKSGRLVKYRPSDVEAWLDSMTRISNAKAA